WRKGSSRFSARCPPGPDAVCRYLLTPDPNPRDPMIQTTKVAHRTIWPEQESTLTTRCNMNVWQCDDSRPVPGLVQAEVKTPEPQRGEVLIRVHAVGVTHTELLWQPTTHTKSGENRRHAIPGHEFSGAIAAVGFGANGVVGEEVF